MARQESHRASRLNHSLCFIPSSALFANLSCRKVAQVHIMSPQDKLLEKSLTSKKHNSFGELYVVRKCDLKTLHLGISTTFAKDEGYLSKNDLLTSLACQNFAKNCS